MNCPFGHVSLYPPVEADDDEGVLQLGDVALRRGHVVDEKSKRVNYWN